jgi:hypothetical protein
MCLLHYLHGGILRDFPSFRDEPDRHVTFSGTFRCFASLFHQAVFNFFDTLRLA